MSKTVEALKAIYTALGGTADDVANVTQTPDILNAIADQIEANAEAAEDDNQNTEETPAANTEGGTTEGGTTEGGGSTEGGGN